MFSPGLLGEVRPAVATRKVWGERPLGSAEHTSVLSDKFPLEMAWGESYLTVESGTRALDILGRRYPRNLF